MNLTELRYFLEVAKESHYTKAANNLNVPQPAISRAVKNLEKEFKIKIFKKDKRNIQLTDYGKIIYKHADIIINELNNIKLELNDTVDNKYKTVTLLVNSASNQIQKLLIDFQKSHKNINLRVRQLDSIEYKEGKINYDLIIRSKETFSQADNQIALLEENLLLAIPKKHPLANKHTINLQDVRNENFIALSPNKDLREIVDYYCQSAGFLPKISYENNSPTIVQDYIKAGLGISFVPSEIWKSLKDNKNIVIKKIHDPICKRYIILEWKKNKYLTQSTETLKQYIVNNFNNYI